VKNKNKWVPGEGGALLDCKNGSFAERKDDDGA